MPIQRVFDPKDRILCTTILGSVTKEDIEDHLRTVRRTGAEACPELIDARFADAGELSLQRLLLIAHRARAVLASRRFTRRAVVVSSEAHFAQARIFATFVAGWLRVGVFDRPETAREWLLQPITLPAMISKAQLASWERPATPAP